MIALEVRDRERLGLVPMPLSRSQRVTARAGLQMVGDRSMQREPFAVVVMNISDLGAWVLCPAADFRRPYCADGSWLSCPRSAVSFEDLCS